MGMPILLLYEKCHRLRQPRVPVGIPKSPRVLMTSNLPFSKWETIFKDAMMTAAAIDRLVHDRVIIELNIPSYRVEARQETTTGGNPRRKRLKRRRGKKRAVEMPGLWKAWKAKGSFPTFPPPRTISQKKPPRPGASRRPKR